MNLNVTEFVLQRLSAGSSSFTGLLNELPSTLPNRNYRLQRALRTLRRRGLVKKCYPGGSETPGPGMLARDRVWTLGREYSWAHRPPIEGERCQRCNYGTVHREDYDMEQCSLFRCNACGHTVEIK